MIGSFGKARLLMVALALVLLANFAEAAKFSTVIIDAGHGGRDKGAYWGGVRESELNLKVARKLEKLLDKKGIRTVMTRDSDKFVSLDRRVSLSKRYRSAVFVSIHFNASRNRGIRGAETFYWSSRGRTLARAVQKRLPDRVNTRNRGVRRYGYTVLVSTSCPAILVECGFISNAHERGRAATDWYQSRAARAIFDGLMACR